MLRICGVILLSLCVLVMPSYAAITCGTACASSSDTHEHDCCPEVAVASAQVDHPAGPHNSSHSDTGRHHHCAASCCGYVAHVLGLSVPRFAAVPLAERLPSAALLHGSVAHDAIFHPPRA